MANSSDWIAALEADAMNDAAREPMWFATLNAEPTGFVAGTPFAPAARAHPQPAPPPATSPPANAEDACEEAFERGHAAGREAALREAETNAQAEAANARALRLSFRALDQAAMDALADELADTVLALCSAALADFAADPGPLAARCKQAAARIGAAAGGFALHLHPDDIAALGPESRDESRDEGSDGWHIIADSALERGALRIEGPDGSISDGPADWRLAISAALKG